MNHQYRKNINGLCAECARPEIEHSDKAICEACSNVGECDLRDNILLCEECMAKDDAILPDSTYDPRRERLVALLNALDKNIPMDRRSYFVGRMDAIVNIEAQLLQDGVSNPQFALAELVEASIIKARERIVAAQKEIQELQGGAVADQRFLNQLVPQLREEEREKFKAYDINYKPNVVVAATHAPSGPRMSANEKAIASAAKMLGVSVEQYQKIMASTVAAVTGNKCTCKETPGMCKVHVKE